LRPLVNGLEVPLILAATEPIDSIYRSVNTYPHLLAQGISGNPETTSDAELAASSRTILDDQTGAVSFADASRPRHSRPGRRRGDPALSAVRCAGYSAFTRERRM